MGQIVEAIVLPESWLDRALARIHLADETRRNESSRKGKRLNNGCDARARSISMTFCAPRNTSAKRDNWKRDWEH